MPSLDQLKAYKATCEKEFQELTDKANQKIEDLGDEGKGDEVPQVIRDLESPVLLAIPVHPVNLDDNTSEPYDLFEVINEAAFENGNIILNPLFTIHPQTKRPVNKDDLIIFSKPARDAHIRTLKEFIADKPKAELKPKGPEPIAPVEIKKEEQPAAPAAPIAAEPKIDEQPIKPAEVRKLVIHTKPENKVRSIVWDDSIKTVLDLQKHVQINTEGHFMILKGKMLPDDTLLANLPITEKTKFLLIEAKLYAKSEMKETLKRFKNDDQLTFVNFDIKDLNLLTAVAKLDQATVEEISNLLTSTFDEKTKKLDEAISAKHDNLSKITDEIVALGKIKHTLRLIQPTGQLFGLINNPTDAMKQIDVLIGNMERKADAVVANSPIAKFNLELMKLKLIDYTSLYELDPRLNRLLDGITAATQGIHEFSKQFMATEPVVKCYSQFLRSIIKEIADIGRLKDKLMNKNQHMAYIQLWRQLLSCTQCASHDLPYLPMTYTVGAALQDATHGVNRAQQQDQKPMQPLLLKPALEVKPAPIVAEPQIDKKHQAISEMKAMLTHFENDNQLFFSHFDIITFDRLTNAANLNAQHDGADHAARDGMRELLISAFSEKATELTSNTSAKHADLSKITDEMVALERIKRRLHLIQPAGLLTKPTDAMNQIDGVIRSMARKTDAIVAKSPIAKFNLALMKLKLIDCTSLNNLVPRPDQLLDNISVASSRGIISLATKLKDEDLVINYFTILQPIINEIDNLLRNTKPVIQRGALQELHTQLIECAYIVGSEFPRLPIDYNVGAAVQDAALGENPEQQAKNQPDQPALAKPVLEAKPKQVNPPAEPAAPKIDEAATAEAKMVEMLIHFKETDQLAISNFDIKTFNELSIVANLNRYDRTARADQMCELLISTLDKKAKKLSAATSANHLDLSKIIDEMLALEKIEPTLHLIHLNWANPQNKFGAVSWGMQQKADAVVAKSPIAKFNLALMKLKFIDYTSLVMLDPRPDELLSNIKVASQGIIELSLRKLKYSDSIECYADFLVTIRNEIYEIMNKPSLSKAQLLALRQLVDQTNFCYQITQNEFHYLLPQGYTVLTATRVAEGENPAQEQNKNQPEGAEPPKPAPRVIPAPIVAKPKINAQPAKKRQVSILKTSTNFGEDPKEIFIPWDDSTTVLDLKKHIFELDKTPIENQEMMIEWSPLKNDALLANLYIFDNTSILLKRIEPKAELKPQGLEPIAGVKPRQVNPPAEPAISEINEVAATEAKMVKMLKDFKKNDQITFSNFDIQTFNNLTAAAKLTRRNPKRDPEKQMIELFFSVFRKKINKLKEAPSANHVALLKIMDEILALENIKHTLQLIQHHWYAKDIIQFSADVDSVIDKVDEVVANSPIAKFNLALLKLKLIDYTSLDKLDPRPDQLLDNIKVASDGVVAISARFNINDPVQRFADFLKPILKELKTIIGNPKIGQNQVITLRHLYQQIASCEVITDEFSRLPKGYTIYTATQDALGENRAQAKKQPDQQAPVAEVQPAPKAAEAPKIDVAPIPHAVIDHAEPNEDRAYSINTFNKILYEYELMNKREDFLPKIRPLCGLMASIRGDDNFSFKQIISNDPVYPLDDRTHVFRFFFSHLNKYQESKDGKEVISHFINQLSPNNKLLLQSLSDWFFKYGIIRMKVDFYLDVEKIEPIKEQQPAPKPVAAAYQVPPPKPYPGLYGPAHNQAPDPQPPVAPNPNPPPYGADNNNAPIFQAFVPYKPEPAARDGKGQQPVFVEPAEPMIMIENFRLNKQQGFADFDIDKFNKLADNAKPKLDKKARDVLRKWLVVAFNEKATTLISEATSASDSLSKFIDELCALDKIKSNIKLLQTTYKEILKGKRLKTDTTQIMNLLDKMEQYTKKVVVNSPVAKLNLMLMSMRLKPKQYDFSSLEKLDPKPVELLADIATLRGGIEAIYQRYAYDQVNYCALFFNAIIARSIALLEPIPNKLDKEQKRALHELYNITRTCLTLYNSFPQDLRTIRDVFNEAKNPGAPQAPQHRPFM